MNRAALVTIIFAYRDRDIVRAKRCFESLKQQSFQDFEVIAVNNGSSPAYSNRFKELCAQYSFIDYVHSYTEGMVWNKPHALNIAIRKANTDLIISSDIDLIFSPNAIEHVVDLASKADHVYSEVYWLPKSYQDWDKLLLDLPTEFKGSGQGGLGGVHLMRKKDLEDIRGYDENYSFWGIEDTDLHRRLEEKGLSCAWAKHEQFPVYHQWHPKISISSDNELPDKHWEQTNIYYALNADKIIRNSDSWGTMIHKNQRKALQILASGNSIPKIQLPKNGTPYHQVQQYYNIIEQLKTLEAGEGIKLLVPHEPKAMKPRGIKRWVLSIIKKILRAFKIDYELVPQTLFKRAKKHRNFIPSIDIKYLTWHLLNHTDLIGDYYIESKDKHTEYTLIKAAE